VTPPVVLTVAGTDSGGGAGVAADLATFGALGVYGALVVTALTAQDTTGVHAVHPVPADMVAAQLDAVFADLSPAVIKTGMLGSAEVVAMLADRVVRSRARHSAPSTARLVVDPVLRASTGAALADDAVLTAYRDVLLPLATVVTPNAAEARALLGLAVDDPLPAPELAARLAALTSAVVVTGGPEVAAQRHRDRSSEQPQPMTSEEAPAQRHRDRSPEQPQPMTPARCTDWLAVAGGGPPIPIEHPAVTTDNDHGTGCTYASALAAHLARGADLATAAGRAAAYVTAQLHLSATWDLGLGRGPVAHIVAHTVAHQSENKPPHTEEIPT